MKAPLSLATLPGGPPPGAKLCDLADLAPGQSRVFTFSEGTARFEMFLHRHGDTVVAYENSCPHRFLPLDWQPGKFLDPAGQHFLCSSHGALFRIEDGACIAGPCPGHALRAILIRVEDGAVYVA